MGSYIQYMASSSRPPLDGVPYDSYMAQLVIVFWSSNPGDYAGETHPRRTRD